jgi:hypothetical protein
VDDALGLAAPSLDALTAELEGFRTPGKDGFYLKPGKTNNFAIRINLDGAEDPVVVVVGADR